MNPLSSTPLSASQTSPQMPAKSGGNLGGEDIGIYAE